MNNIAADLNAEITTYCSRIDVISGAPIAPSASAASCLTIGSWLTSSKISFNIHNARLSCICPKQ
uniref:Uncharacterized protein n=1 Tax=Glossina brevipalpis TaxID=37001 RepID=A0A1A9WF74_9MUSC